MASVDSGFLFFCFLEGDDWATQNGILSVVSRIGLRGVFQYCVTRYLIVWPFLGALPFSTVLQSECKRSRSRKARQSFYNLLKIVFHT